VLHSETIFTNMTDSASEVLSRPLAVLQTSVTKNFVGVIVFVVVLFYYPPVYGEGLRPIGCGDCGFDSCQGHGCLSVVSVVYCQVGGSVTGRSLV
jgi:hypothetical protein